MNKDSWTDPFGEKRNVETLFDEEVHEVGDEIVAYSPKLKCDTPHVIISMYEGEVRRVQCMVSGDVHAYRKPRGEPMEASSEPAPRSRRFTKKPSWEEAMASCNESDFANCRPYSIRDTYEEMDIVRHPKFDIGFVTELLPDNKLEITFNDHRRVLVHNRSDLAKQMPSISEIPAPREIKKKRRKKRPPSELAARLLEQRRKQTLTPSDFAEQSAAKLAAAERAADAASQLASQITSGNAESTQEFTKGLERERKRQAREEERQRKLDDRAAEKERKRQERDLTRAQKAKEREREQARKAKEREREQARKAKEREREQARKAKEREKLLKQRELENLRAQKERERLRIKRDREQLQARRKRDLAARAKGRVVKGKTPKRATAASQRRPATSMRRIGGGKKTVSRR